MKTAQHVYKIIAIVSLAQSHLSHSNFMIARSRTVETAVNRYAKLYRPWKQLIHTSLPDRFFGDEMRSDCLRGGRRIRFARHGPSKTKGLRAENAYKSARRPNFDKFLPSPPSPGHAPIFYMPCILKCGETAVSSFKINQIFPRLFRRYKAR
jgi:hypothetical protein